MEILRELSSVFRENGFLTVVFFCGGGGILLSAVLGYLFKDTGVYTALWSMVLGLSSLALLWGRGGLKTGITCFALLSTLGGGGYLALFSALAIKKAVSERKRRRLESVRKLCYALPDRENSFVRNRLQTALSVPETEETGMKRQFDLGYARTLLSKVKSAPLSVAERLETDEINRLFGLYLKKDEWTASDYRAANEVLARLLKLSAKYAV